jgi:hypothetical protein
VWRKEYYIPCAPKLNKQLIAALRTSLLESCSNFMTPEIAGRISCCSSAKRKLQSEVLCGEKSILYLVLPNLTSS